VADAGKLAAALLDAQVDLNPHQVEAALFAFKSPLSKGAILADEVGLGKTIEAGLVVAQKWTEGRRVNRRSNIAGRMTQFINVFKCNEHLMSPPLGHITSSRSQRAAKVGLAYDVDQI
jgi:hypothetical protein